MPTAWPPSLPDYIPINTTLRDADLVILQPTTTGPGKTRSRYTVSHELVEMRMPMTAAQLATFHNFFRSTLRSGELPFTWEHPITGLDAEYRFTPGQPPTYTALGADKTLVQMSFQVVDGPSVSQYTPPSAAPSNSFDFGLSGDEFAIATDATMAALLTDPNGAGFSYGVWFKATPGDISVREGIAGSSDSYTTYSEGTALMGAITPPPASVRFMVEDYDDGLPANWTETAPAAADDNLWHFAVCIWDPSAVGSRRVRLFFDGALTGAGGNHPGDLTETWARKFWARQGIRRDRQRHPRIRGTNHSRLDMGWASDGCGGMGALGRHRQPGHPP